MQDWLKLQFENRFMYVPFLLAFGAGLYFTATQEPNLAILLTVGTVAIAGLFVRQIPNIIRAILILSFGFSWAGIYTHIINTPVLNRDLRNVQLVGTVHATEHNDNNSRLLLTINANDIGIKTNNTANVRLSILDNIQIPNAGDTVQISGALFRPSIADAPETFDFARWAYFNNLTATGYATDIQIIKQNTNANISYLRDILHNNANSFLADALVLGYKNAVPETDKETWFSVGIGHVWSISGFHMTLVGGWLFIVFYTIFRAIPYITRRIPAKIPAMACAEIGLLGYLILSGGDIATLRAFLMTTLIFIAFAIGRSVISLRNVALVFCIIFLINPHSVMQAGFQLSFAAVFGLVWMFTVVKPKMPRNKLLKISWATILTTLTATVFTAPFVAIHFGAIPTYGILGNLIFLPIFSLLIMPAVLIGIFTTSIFGFSAPINFAHLVYEYAMGAAQYFSNLPAANINTPYIANAVVICIIVGFVCLINIRNIKFKSNICLCGLFCAAGLTVMTINSKPIFFATNDHVLVGFVNQDGKLEFNKSRDSNHKFTFDTWKQINGQSGQHKNIRRKHDHGVYKFETAKFNLVYIQKFVPLMKNLGQICDDNNTDYIVSYFHINAPMCEHKILKNGFVIYPNGRVRYTPFNRRWHHNRHEQNTAPTPAQ